MDITRRVASGAALLMSIVACADDSPMSSGAEELELRRKITQSSTAPFACGVEFTVVSTVSDDVLASYGMPTLTDTARVCGTWTGSDYKVHVEQIGTSEPRTETQDSLHTVMVDGGVVSGKEATGAPIEEPSSVAANAFDLGQATANEQEASYSEPYYGVTGDGGSGETCQGDPTAVQCPNAQMRMEGAVSANPRAKEVKMKEHGFKRGSTRALTGDKDEIAKGPNGHRRFRSVEADVETILEIDPATELISAQETKSKDFKTVAKLKWKKDKKGRHFRELMEIDHEEVVEGIKNTSKATLRILDLKIGGV